MSMPVAAGMDAMEEAGQIVGMSTSPSDTSANTHMREDRLAPLNTPELFDWKTNEPGSSPSGTGEAASGTPATASGVGGGMTSMPATGNG